MTCACISQINKPQSLDQTESLKLISLTSKNKIDSDFNNVSVDSDTSSSYTLAVNHDTTLTTAIISFSSDSDQYSITDSPEMEEDGGTTPLSTEISKKNSLEKGLHSKNDDKIGNKMVNEIINSGTAASKQNYQPMQYPTSCETVDNSTKVKLFKNCSQESNITQCYKDTAKLLMAPTIDGLCRVDAQNYFSKTMKVSITFCKTILVVFCFLIYCRSELYLRVSLFH